MIPSSAAGTGSGFAGCVARDHFAGSDMSVNYNSVLHCNSECEAGRVDSLDLQAGQFRPGRAGTFSGRQLTTTPIIQGQNGLDINSL